MNPPMVYSKDGLWLTKKAEGCSLTSYPDSGGVWTIGYGHTRDVFPGQTITMDRAEQFLFQDMRQAVADVNHEVHVPLTQNEFDALVDFTFNLGGSALHRSTLLRLVNSSDFEHAAKEFDRWDMTGGHRIAGLLRRRQAEGHLFLTSASASNGATAPTAPAPAATTPIPAKPLAGQSATDAAKPLPL